MIAREDWSGCQYDLAGNVLGRLGREGLSRLGQRVDRADLRAQHALVNEATDFAELSPARVAHKAHGADVVTIGWWGSDDGHDCATGLDDRRRVSEHVAADDVVDEV